MSTERYARRIELPDFPVADWTRIPNEGETFKDGTNVYVGDGVTAANALTPINGGGSGTGDVVGPASATDNAIARYNLATGKLIQNSTVLLDDNGKLGQVDAIDFDTTPTSAPAAGRMIWDSTEGSPAAGLSGGNVTALMGTDLHVLCYNDTGSAFAKGEVVRVNGSSGTRLKIAYAQADGDPNSAETIGLVAESIGNNSSGYVITRGLIRSVNTNAFNEGDVLYLSPSTPGGITNVKPQAPDHMVRVGYCIKKAGGAGIIYVDPLNGFEINELHDVRITTPDTNTCGLYWNSTDDVWENKTPADARTALGLVIGTNVQAYDAELAAVASTTSAADKIIQFTGAGTATTQDFKTPATQTLSGGITITAGGQPSGTTNHAYSWNQIGNLVTYQFTLRWANAGTTVTNVLITKPSDMPDPYEQSNLTGASANLYPTTLRAANGTTGSTTANNVGSFRRNSGDTAYEFNSPIGSGTYSVFYLFGSYFTQ